MIKPTVGRVVWYWPHGNRVTKIDDKPVQPNAAIICYVHSDILINLAVFTELGSPYQHINCDLVQDDRVRDGPCATWMPYQLGQAARTEAQKQIGGVA